MIARGRFAKRDGITLLEVLLSMGIFLLAMTALTRLMDIATDSALDATFRSDANRLAQSKLAEIEAGVIPPDLGSGGTFDAEPAWSWTMQSEPWSVPNLYTVSVTVSRTTGKAVSVTHSQIVFDSRQMGKSGEIAKPETTAGAMP
jgi:general secretion pathway protein I